MSYRRFAAAIALVAAGCVSRVTPDEYIVRADEDGNLVDPATAKPIAETEIDRYFERQLDLVERWSDSQGGTNGDRYLLVYVHGGMVDPDRFIDRALVRADQIQHDPCPDDRYYPIFVAWPSEGLDSYWQHLVSIRQGRASPIGGPLSAPVIAATDLLEGLVHVPQDWTYQLTTDLQQGGKVAFDKNLMSSWQNADAMYRHVQQHESECFPIALGDYERGALTQAARFVSYVVTLPLKLFSSAFVLDGLGSEAWGIMLRRAHSLVHRPQEFDACAGCCTDDKLASALRSPPSGALARFLAALDRRVAADAQQQRHWQIVLVGHSMGTIVWNDALPLCESLPITDLVYMASACSIGEAERSVVPFLHDHGATRFHMLALHPLAEAEEIEEYDAVPRGSLLEWIDSWYTTPSTHSERRLGKFVNVMNALSLFNEPTLRSRVSLKAFAVECDDVPQKHGEFAQLPFWERACWDPKGPLHFPRTEGDAQY